MKLKFFLTTALCLVGLLTPLEVSAATFSVRLGQPKSPTNQNSVKLTYVALDSDNREIVVKCFKKGPSDGGYSQFDVTKTMIPGGNTDHCLADSNVITTKGTYSFYITGQIGGETLSSSTITLDYNTDGPGTPSDYSKEKINNCDYKIKFKTADDGGKTVKVQLFRSDNLSVSVDSSSVIATKTIGSNTSGEIINSVPDCSKNYYFVLRAVDSSDNVSGTVGDNFTTTKTTTSTSTTTTSGAPGTDQTGAQTAQALITSDGSQVTDPSSQGEATDGVTDASEDTGSTTSSEPTPEVLGATSGDNKLLILLFAIGLLITGYFFIFKKGTKKTF